MKDSGDKEAQLRPPVQQNAQGTLLAPNRAEEELLKAQAALECKTQELLQQREWFEATLSSIGDAVITTDTRCHITFMNPVAELLTGWSKEEAAGRDLVKVCNIIDEKTRKPAQNLAAEVLRKGRIVTAASHLALIGRNGAVTAIEDRTAPIRDLNGNIMGAVMVFHDVEEQRRAADSLHEDSHALRILNETGAAIAAQQDVEEVVEIVTNATTRLSGAQFGAFFYNKVDEEGNVLTLYSLAGADRDQFSAFGHPRSTELLGPTFEGKPPIRIDDVLQDSRYGASAPHHGLPEGHLPVRSYMAVPVISRTGSVIGGLFFGHSECGVFTERAERIVIGIAAHAAVAIDNVRLYQEAQYEITRRQQAEETLQRTDRLRDEFLALLSHELRNPLAPIRQAASIWRQENLSDEQLLWSQKVIERQSRHMSLLLDDLLDMSRIKRGHLVLRKQWVDFTSIVDAAIETASPLIKSRQHQLTVDLAPASIYLEADPTRLTQILANLLNNAAKYTEPHGSISLSTRLLDDTLEISVSDTGIGISKELLPQIFATFFQSSATLDRVDGGLGLGLALVKGIVSLHGGQVRASSKGVGMGSLFTVLLPVGKSPGEWIDPTPREVGDGANDHSRHTVSRILIADDNRDMADSLALYMQLRGHEVNTVYSGEEAITIFAATRPDIVILDIGMPRLNGYETARRIRAADSGQKVMLIALTGWGQDADKKLAFGAGFDFHFTKPINPECLAELFERPEAAD